MTLNTQVAMRLDVFLHRYSKKAVLAAYYLSHRDELERNDPI
jgi:hypothetical protein